MNFSNITELHKHFHKTNTCPLKNTATQPVFGHGNPKSKIIFIGEAPGKQEDEQGIPFVGRAGQLLSELLSEQSIQREDIYITNIVKYRPANNRDPLPEEKEACAPWLIAEINYIKPKVIAFLGRHSMTHFFPNLKISETHGKIIKKTFENIPTNLFFSLYHPATALYNPSMKETLRSDITKLFKALEKINNTINT